MKPSIPKGTRDFTPEQVRKRNFLFDIIRQVFVRYGYQPIETSAMENLSTLTGKYGEEGDKLLFKVLNNGDFLSKADEKALETRDSAGLAPSIARRGLRYDLTVPFARFVVMNQHLLSFPFKRYQIQPVWRADRPQKGRYQEFFQCDVDVVGSDSLLYEAELAVIYDEVFTQLGLKVRILLNNRKVLAGMAEVAGIADRFMDMTIAIDKLDKIGMDGVKKELAERGIAEGSISLIENLLANQSLGAWKKELANSETGQKGIEELETMQAYLAETTLTNEVVFDPTLARGLSYYTGCIFEVQAIGAEMGSIGGGGRYDDLTSVFGLPNVSGVGVSFGAERIYDVMEELDLFPANLSEDLSVLFVAFDEPTHRFAFRCLSQVRKAGIAADLYPEPAKLKKQMKYANDRKVPYVVLIGSEEMASGSLTLKHMESGEQQQLPLDELIEKISK
ncbi:MAG: histidine--tRNA ligase [Saprospirales bacterium]|nr:histidine--tRNA ligase [Saprospirales bacterium]MBK8491696.1 histidine--tRNA ligase [Saprospirales bacterium]